MRLIDADALKINLLSNAAKFASKNPRFAFALTIAVDLINITGTIEAEPVRRSKWISLNNSSRKFCESCGVEFNIHFYEENDYRFCPYCGAKMDGGK